MKLLTIKIFGALCLFIGMTTFFSCEDEELNTDEVVLLSFGPSGVVHGDEIVFIGQNMDKVTSLVMKPNITIEKSQFIGVSRESFKVVVPDGAEAGKIMLNTPKGQIESKSLLNFKVDVVISSITSEAKPGTNITITGTKINWIESVTFASDVVVEKDDFVSQSLTELVVTVPMEAESGFLIFATGGTDPLTFASAEELTVTLPAVTSLNPESIRHTDDLTLTGTDLDLVTEIIFTDGVSVLAADFVSQSETQIVVTVPASVVKGTLTLKQLSPIDVTTGELTIVLPAGTSVAPKPATPGVDNITITGTNLDLVEELVLPGSGAVASSAFISQSSTEIVLALPEETKSGVITYKTIHGYENALGVAVIIPSAGLPPLLVPVFEEAISDLMTSGGWGAGYTDFANTENPREGSTAIKIDFPGGYGGGGQMGTWDMDNLSIAGTEVFAFSVFGGPGTDGEQLNVNVKLDADNPKLFTIKEGEWVDYEIPVSEFGSFTEITEVWFQDQGWSGTVYIDRVGFGMPSGPPELTVVAYDDAISDVMDAGGWGSSYTDYANEEQKREGDFSIKVSFPGGWGGGGQLMTSDANLSIAGMSVFAFSIYGGTGTDGKELNVNVKLDADNPQIVTITEGEWVDVEIPISDFGSFTEITEIWFQDRDWSGDVYIDYIGFR